MKIAAKIISYLFHPLLLATYLVLVIGKFFPAMLMMISYRHVMLVALFVFAFTFLFPAINLWLLRTLGSISSLQLESRHERKQPFVIITIMYVLVAYLFYVKLPFSANFNKLMTIVAVLVITATVLTFFIKVSVHSLAMGGWIGILFPLIRFAPELLWPTAAITVIAGLVISARLYLNAHTMKEVVIGAAAGVAVGYGGMVVLF
ncbi:MAG TPA: phosphatase PAP2 family protein [Cyclobacteriaceae bacterium]|nr:phosphatase PAP2 family protein [Cyclobacteriaceae bacterium]